MTRVALMALLVAAACVVVFCVSWADEGHFLGQEQSRAVQSVHTQPGAASPLGNRNVDRTRALGPRIRIEVLQPDGTMASVGPELRIEFVIDGVANRYGNGDRLPSFRVAKLEVLDDDLCVLEWSVDGDDVTVTLAKYCYVPVAVDAGPVPLSFAALRTCIATFLGVDRETPPLNVGLLEGGARLLVGVQYSASLACSGPPISPPSVKFRAPADVVFVVEEHGFLHVVTPDGPRNGIVTTSGRRPSALLRDGHAWLSREDVADARPIYAWGPGWQADVARPADAIDGTLRLEVHPADTLLVIGESLSESTTVQYRSKSVGYWTPLDLEPIRDHEYRAAWSRRGSVLVLAPPEGGDLVFRIPALGKLAWGLHVGDEREVMLRLPEVSVALVPGEEPANVIESLGLGGGFDVRLEQRVGGLETPEWRPVRLWHTQGPYMKLLRRRGFDLPRGEGIDYRLVILDRHDAVQRIVPFRP